MKIWQPNKVRERIEGPDVILCFGVIESDLDLGGFSANIRDEQMVRAGTAEVRIGSARYPGVWLKDFIPALQSVDYAFHSGRRYYGTKAGEGLMRPGSNPCRAPA